MIARLSSVDLRVGCPMIVVLALTASIASSGNAQNLNAARVGASPAVVTIASVIVPGAGQAIMRQRRTILYVALEGARTIRPEFRWSWLGAAKPFQKYRAAIASSNSAFRNAEQTASLVLATQFLSAIDAYVPVHARVTNTLMDRNG